MRRRLSNPDAEFEMSSFIQIENFNVDFNTNSYDHTDEWFTNNDMDLSIEEFSALVSKLEQQHEVSYGEKITMKLEGDKVRIAWIRLRTCDPKLFPYYMELGLTIPYEELKQAAGLSVREN